MTTDDEREARIEIAAAIGTYFAGASTERMLGIRGDDSLREAATEAADQWLSDWTRSRPATEPSEGERYPLPRQPCPIHKPGPCDPACPYSPESYMRRTAEPPLTVSDEAVRAATISMIDAVYARTGKKVLDAGALEDDVRAALTAALPHLVDGREGA